LFTAGKKGNGEGEVARWKQQLFIVAFLAKM